MGKKVLVCDICGHEIGEGNDKEDVGYIKNDGNELVVKCDKCHSPERRSKRTSYGVL